MMITLHPTYTLRVTIQEPDAQPLYNPTQEISRGLFWDGIRDKSGTGCDDVLIAVLEALKATPLGKHVRVDLEKFEQRPRCG